MKKINFISLFLFTLLMLTAINAGKCWYVTDLVSASPNQVWTNSTQEQICIDSNCWDRIVFSNSELTISGFGTYNLLCDNGVAGSTRGYGVFSVKNDQRFGSDLGLEGLSYNKIFGNTSSGVAGSIGLPYCYGINQGSTAQQFNVIPNCGASKCTGASLYAQSVASSLSIGKGTLDVMKFIVLDEFGPALSKQLKYIGGYDYNFAIMQEPIAGTYTQKPKIESSSVPTNFFFAPPSSVFILPLGDDTIGFYEKNGNYEKEVYFTIKAQTYIDLSLKDFEIECTGANVTCTLDPNRITNPTMGKNNDVLIVSATISTPKNPLPKEINYKLKLKYDVTNLVSFGPEYRDINIESSLSKINIGYLDKQDFQVKIIGGITDNTCIGHNGLVGVTGEAVAPRINIDTKFPNGFDENICSPENDDWVYCSQRETLAVFANKIWELFELYYQAENTVDPNIKNQIYDEINSKKTFDIYVRNLDLDKIDELLPEDNTLFTTDPFLALDGADQEKNIKRAKELFENVQFFRNNGVMLNKKIEPAKYTITVELFGPVDSLGGTDIFQDLPAASIDPDFSSNVLFTADDELIEPDKLNLKINFTKTGGEPLIKWFFYEVGVENLTDQLDIQSPTLFGTQIEKRGQVMAFNQNLTDFQIDDIKIYPNYAIPLFIKVDKNETFVSNKLELTNSNAVDNINGLINANPAKTFSYWTGFASSLNDGCGELLLGEDTLVYRLDDKIEIKSATAGANEFLINLYPSTVQADLRNGKEYLQTVIYAPIFGLGNPFSAKLISRNNGFTKNLFGSNVICTTSNECSLDINKANSNFIVDRSFAISNIIQGIKNSDICVNANQIGLDSTVDWTIFWNEEKIIETLRTNKDAVINADSTSKYCAGLER